MFGPANFVGLGLLALWVYVRYPSRRPGTLLRAMVRVAASIVAFCCLPPAFHAYGSVFPGKEAAIVFFVVVLMPALCFVLTTWVWLLAALVESFGPRTPNDGHRVNANAAA